jgi:hypothetical protein
MRSDATHQENGTLSPVLESSPRSDSDNRSDSAFFLERFVSKLEDFRKSGGTLQIECKLTGCSGIISFPVEKLRFPDLGTQIQFRAATEKAVELEASSMVATLSTDALPNTVGAGFELN